MHATVRDNRLNWPYVHHCVGKQRRGRRIGCTVGRPGAARLLHVPGSARDFLGAPNVAIILLVGVQGMAVLGGRRGALIGAIVAAISFDFFFTEPYLRLVINDRRDIITAALLLVTGIATSELGNLRFRRQLRRRDDHGS